MKYLKRILVGIFIFVLGVTSVLALDVGIKKVSIEDKSSDSDVSTPVINNNNIDSTIKFYDVGDYVTFEVDLDDGRVITGVSDNNDSEYVKTSYRYSGSKFYLTLSYDKAITTSLDLDDIQITVNFDDGTSMRINPLTSDGLWKYIIILALSLCGLIAGIKFSKKKSTAAILILLLLPVGVFANEKLSSTYNFKVENVSIADRLTITYVANGGTGIPDSTTIAKGKSIGTLPSPTRENYVLEGWYLESTFGTKINSSYVPEDSIPIYAKWLKSVGGSTVTPSSINMSVGGTQSIVVTNVEEDYSYSSGNTGIASVSDSGVVTGVAEGNTSITITGDLSGETKTVSVAVTAANPITYKTRQVSGQITKGDVIAIGDEEFYVVSSNSTSTSVLAKYNLYVGDIMDYNSSNNDVKWSSTLTSTDEGYGLQNQLAVGQKMGNNKYYGTVAFSGAKYWNDSEYENVYKSELSGTEPSYNYDPKPSGAYAGGTAYDNGYTIAYFVERYVTKLKEIGAPDTITGRLIVNQELEDLECYGEYMCTNSDYDWVYSTSYWTGSFSQDVGSQMIGFISSANVYDYNKYSSNASYGVRPVIVINTSDIPE